MLSLEESFVDFIAFSVASSGNCEAKKDSDIITILTKETEIQIEY